MYKSTVSLTPADLRRAILLSLALRDHVDALAPLAKPIVWIDAIPGAPESPLASRFGGDQTLMLDEAGWPTWIKEPYLGSDSSSGTFTVYYGDPTECPLTFLAQINLAELPPVSPLPRAGLLSFFVDANEAPWGNEKTDRDGFRVFFTPPERLAELKPRPMPNGPPTRGVFEAKPLKPCRMRFATRYQIPIFEELDPALQQRIDEGAYAKLADFLYGFSYHNLMFGVPNTHQHDPRTIAERMTGGTRLDDDLPYKEYKRRAAEIGPNWEVLLSVIDSDDLKLRVSGCLTFLIRRSDLAAGRFDDGWFVRGS